MLPAAATTECYSLALCAPMLNTRWCDGFNRTGSRTRFVIKHTTLGAHAAHGRPARDNILDRMATESSKPLHSISKSSSLS